MNLTINLTPTYDTLISDHFKAIDSGNFYDMFLSGIRLYDYTGDVDFYDMAIRTMKYINMEDLLTHFKIL